MKHFFLLQE